MGQFNKIGSFLRLEKHRVYIETMVELTKDSICY
jgi:hypothetical protein